MKLHLLAIGGEPGGRRLNSVELAEVTKSIKALGARAKAKPRRDLGGKSAEDMLAEALKYPEFRQAWEAMGKG